MQSEDDRFPVALTLVFYLFLFSAGWVWIYFRGEDLFRYLVPSWRKFFNGLLLGAAVALLLIGVNVLAEAFFPAVRKLSAIFRSILGPLRFQEVLVLALASGIGEEVFFRGALQPVFGLLLTSLLFGFLHVGPSRVFLLWTFFALVSGFLLGFLFQTTGCLAAPIGAHFTVNCINLMRLCRRRRMPAGSDPLF